MAFARYVYPLIAVALLIGAGRTDASTVVDFNATQLSHYAAQVIVADVTASESYVALNPKRIETKLTLSNIEYWKGAYEGAPTTFELIVPGGKVGESEMRICCAPEFEKDQRWVFFLLPTYKTFPTVGLGQGAFRIINDEDGVGRVYQEGAAGIAGINADGAFEYVSNEQRHAHAHSPTGQLRIKKPETTESNTAITLDDFKESIQPILDNSRAYELNEPAGKRILVTYRPTVFRTAANSTAARSAGDTPSGEASVKARMPEKSVGNPEGEAGSESKSGIQKGKIKSSRETNSRLGEVESKNSNRRGNGSTLKESNSQRRGGEAGR